MAMGRISEDLVAKAYQKTGLDPITGDFYRVKGAQGAACGLGAVAMFRTFSATGREWEQAEIAEYLNLKESYVEGFTWGFDYGKNVEGKIAESLVLRERRRSDLDFEDGIADGKAAQARMHPESSGQWELRQPAPEDHDFNDEDGDDDAGL